MTDRNQREFYRVDYPAKERPSLTFGEQEFQVVECSETGLRYELPNTETPPAIGEVVRGVVRFRGDEDVEIEGTVQRMDRRGVAILLTELKIPFRIIVSEQKYLRAHYLMRGH
jgi:hypothetical protein